LGWLVYTQIFNLQWQSFWAVWIGLPVGSGVLVGLIGRWSARQARQLPPAQLLKIADG